VISYSVYLIHAPLMRRVYVALLPLHLTPAANLLLFELVASPLMLGCGWLYFRAIEARFMRSGTRSTGAGTMPRAYERMDAVGVSAVAPRSS
jgi:peptidoglycan/LPS O-acetylase OafA/YrhL